MLTWTNPNFYLIKNLQLDFKLFKSYQKEKVTILKASFINHQKVKLIVDK
jgi:hypothetical protein